MQMLKIPSLISKFCDTVWEYDPEANQVYFYYDTMTPELCNQWISYDTISQMYKEKYVYPLDMAIWDYYLTPESMKSFSNRSAEECHFYIRLQYTQKGIEWHEVYLQRIENNHVLLVSKDIKENQRNEVIAHAVMPEFDYVCCIDIETGSYVLYYSDSMKTIVPQNASDNYHKILEEFNQLYVVPEEAEKATEAMRIERVLEELKHQDEYVLYVTVKDHDGLAYKKICFRYESESKKKLLLTRIDVGELARERKLRQIEEQKRLLYLENMPVAFCSVEVLVDEEGKPYDFCFVYCNRAHEELEGVKRGELIGKGFYEFFKETDPVWLTYYYETAYQGIEHVIRRYSPEIKKHLLIYTFQSEVGRCECVLLDESEQYFLMQELQQNRENMKRILETMTVLAFEYRPEKGEVILNGRNEAQRIMKEEEFFCEMAEEEKIESSYQEIVQKSFRKMKDGEHISTIVVRGKLYGDDRWIWYRVTMFDFQDEYTHERKVLGFVQNIDQDMSREQLLKKRAQMDSLTEVFNPGMGRYEISKKLEHPGTEQRYNAMFVMDMDDFKGINDTKGHMVGDKVLQEFARVLRKTFRAEDVIYRLGGDEFVVFADNIHEPEKDIMVIMQRFYGHIEEVRKTYPFFACSIGIFVTNKQRTFEEYYEAADRALYETKNSGKGFYTIKREDEES